MQFLGPNQMTMRQLTMNELTKSTFKPRKETTDSPGLTRASGDWSTQQSTGSSEVSFDRWYQKYQTSPTPFAHNAYLICDLVAGSVTSLSKTMFLPTPMAPPVVDVVQDLMRSPASLTSQARDVQMFHDSKSNDVLWDTAPTVQTHTSANAHVLTEPNLL